MKLLINLENSEKFDEIQIELSDTIETLKYLIEASFSIPFQEISLLNSNTGEPYLYADLTLISKTNILPDSMLIVRKIKKPSVDSILNMLGSNNKVITSNKNQSNISNNNNNVNLGSIFDDTMKLIENNRDNGLKQQVKQEAKEIYNRCMIDPGELSILFNTDIELAEAISSESLSKVEEVLFNRLKKYRDHMEKERKEYESLLRGDSNDPQAQMKIEAYIHKQKIQENKKMAIEYFPESFFSHHHMLYIPLEINSFKVIALVDTGAQMTVMSIDIAHKCGLYNLIDKDYAGQAVGVGTSKIIGVIHCAQLKVFNKYIMAKIHVLENVSVGFIFGLDNMRSHRCTIELSSNSLIFKDAGFSVQFLSDGDAKKLKEEHEAENLELLKKSSSSIDKNSFN